MIIAFQYAHAGRADKRGIAVMVTKKGLPVKRQDGTMTPRHEGRKARDARRARLDPRQGVPGV
jgi:hypothetical protein